MPAGIFNQPSGTERVEEFLERGRHCSFVSFVIGYRIGQGVELLTWKFCAKYLCDGFLFHFLKFFRGHEVRMI